MSSFMYVCCMLEDGSEPFKCKRNLHKLQGD